MLLAEFFNIPGIPGEGRSKEEGGGGDEVKTFGPSAAVEAMKA